MYIYIYIYIYIFIFCRFIRHMYIFLFQNSSLIMKLNIENTKLFPSKVIMI